MSSDIVLDRALTLEIVRVTEQAAIAAAKFRGKGDEKGADRAAVDAMRQELNRLPISGRIVIGEGERDEAPMLFIGEEVGAGGMEVDIAVDPLEGTTICAKALPGSLAVIAIAPKGALLHAPDIYMDKIAVGPGFPEGIVDLDRTPAENLAAVAAAKGCDVSDLTACILDRPRHEAMIDAVRSAGAAVHLIGDGDIAGVIQTTDSMETGVDIYMGIGGAPEGVLAAAALRCIGGQIQCRLHPLKPDDAPRAARIGITDIDRKYSRDELAMGDVIFAASGVTDGALLDGVGTRPDGVTTDTLVMRAATGTVRRIATEHRRRG